LGFKDADDLVARYPDTVSQLEGPVKDYFNLPGNKPPYPTKQSLYMAVFRPAARTAPLSTPLPDNLRDVNRGINTMADYIEKVDNSRTKKLL
jgi:hypothetical protein